MRRIRACIVLIVKSLYLDSTEGKDPQCNAKFWYASYALSIQNYILTQCSRTWPGCLLLSSQSGTDVIVFEEFIPSEIIDKISVISSIGLRVIVFIVRIIGRGLT